MSDYPEHVKAHASRPYSQKIGEFVEWLAEEKQIWLMSDDDSRHPRCHNNDLTKLLHEFFEIDYEAFHKEKDRMLEVQRALNDETPRCQYCENPRSSKGYFGSSQHIPVSLCDDHVKLHRSDFHHIEKTP